MLSYLKPLINIVFIITMIIIYNSPSVHHSRLHDPLAPSSVSLLWLLVYFIRMIYLVSILLSPGGLGTVYCSSVVVLSGLFCLCNSNVFFTSIFSEVMLKVKCKVFVRECGLMFDYRPHPFFRQSSASRSLWINLFSYTSQFNTCWLFCGYQPRKTIFLFFCFYTFLDTSAQRQYGNKQDNKIHRSGHRTKEKRFILVIGKYIYKGKSWIYSNFSWHLEEDKYN